MEPKKTFALSTLSIAVLVAFAIGFVAGLGAARKVNPCVVVPTISIQRDTLIQRDTVRGEILPPRVRTIIRRDTLILPTKADTSFKRADTSKFQGQASPQANVLPDGRVVLPIEQKTYTADLYRAVVSGYRVSLDTIEVYPETRMIRETVTKLAQPPRKWLALTAGPSLTYTASKQIVPGASVTLGVLLKSW